MEMLMLNLLKPIQKQKVLSLRLSWILLGKKAHQSLLRLKIDNDWRCSCEISTNGTNRFMSTVKRNVYGKPLLKKTGMYSFIEDWNRSKDAEGFK